MRLKMNLVICSLLLGLLSVSPLRADSATVGDISKELVCQCGCNMVLSNCIHAECHSRESMMASIKGQLAQGRSKDEIVQSFVQQYGEQVLAAPTKRGFNLVVWVLPFGGLAVGAGVVYATLRVWTRQGKRPQMEDAGTEEEDEEYGRRLEKELEEFTERGFR